MSKNSYRIIAGIWLLFSFSLNAQKVNRAGIQFVQANAPSFGLSASDVQDIVLKDSYKNASGNWEHQYIQQRWNGIEIYNGIFNLAVLADGSIANSNHRFTAGLEQGSFATSPNLSAFAALDIALEKLNLSSVNNPVLTKEASGANEYQEWELTDIARGEIQQKLVYFELAKGDVRLCWDLDIDQIDGQHWWSIRMDATTGEVVDQFDRVHNCFSASAAMGHALCSHSMAASSSVYSAPPPPPESNQYMVLAIPQESPIHGEQSLVDSPWLEAGDAGDLGWHHDGIIKYPITRGNNVWVSEDRDGNNIAGYSPESPLLEFIYGFDEAQSSLTNQDASMTNLFYWNNVMHDVWYQYGFDENSGNFQNNNLDRGGIQGDFVRADAQDGIGLNNANFATGPDGTEARMQMFEWTYSGNSVQFKVAEPTNIAGSYTTLPALFGPKSPGTPGLTGELVVADDGTENGIEACGALINDQQMEGKIALVDRGTCAFTEKVMNCQNAGAIAVIVCNSDANGLIAMGGESLDVAIPAVAMTQADCTTIKVEVANGVTVNLTTTTFDRDSSMDAGIVCHEYGHGISIRLTGGPSAGGCLTNQEQMGEGWSDWMALMMTMDEGDLGDDLRGVGSYVMFQSKTGKGLRPTQYSTNTEVNDYTYSDRCNSEIYIPHGVGFLWSTMLWEMTWALTDKYGFDSDLYSGIGGNNIAMQLVLDGLKLQPCNPGFVDGRDAILKADELRYGGANACLIWEAFSKRGLGFSADQGSNNDKCDGAAAFDKPPFCSGALVLDIKENSASGAAVGDTLEYRLIATNYSQDTLFNVAMLDTLPLGLKYIDESAGVDGEELDGVVSFILPKIAPNTSKEVKFSGLLLSEETSEVVFKDEAENEELDLWEKYHNQGSLDWTLSDVDSYSGESSWFITDSPTQSDVMLELAEAITIVGQKPELRFWHRYQTESTWDGGVIEVSTNGVDWLDLGASIIQNGYNSTIQVNPDSNISGREAFSGNSLAYVETVVDLSSYIDQEIEIRFRFSSDAFVGDYGWHIDDIQLIDAFELVNRACATNENSEILAIAEARTLVLEADCKLTSLVLKAPTGFSFPLDFCKDELIEMDSISIFDENGSLTSTNVKSELFLIKKEEEEHVLKDQKPLGESFDFTILEPGVYEVLGLSYRNSDSNEATDIWEMATSKEDVLSIAEGFECWALHELAEGEQKAEIRISELPEITSVETVSEQICAGSVTELSLIIENVLPEDIEAYEWKIIEGEGALSAADQSAVILESSSEIVENSTITVEAMIRNTNGCEARRELVLEIFVSPEISEILSSKEITCGTSPVSLSAITNSIDSELIYSWSLVSGLGEIIDPESTSPTFVPQAVGLFEIELSVTSENGCAALGSKIIEVRSAFQTIQVNAALEAAYDEEVGLMRNNLQESGLLPSQQPFGVEPWNYEGDELVDLNEISEDLALVDWVLLEFLSEEDTSLIARKAVLMGVDGKLIDAESLTAELKLFNLSCDENYFMVIRHRNHLPAVSKNSLELYQNPTFSFVDPEQVKGGLDEFSQLVELDNGAFSLRSGDFNANGTILTDDYNVFVEASSAINSYLPADLNLDGQVTVFDFNYYQGNTSAIAPSYIRY